MSVNLQKHFNLGILLYIIHMGNQIGDEVY